LFRRLPVTLIRDWYRNDDDESFAGQSRSWAVSALEKKLAAQKLETDGSFICHRRVVRIICNDSPGHFESAIRDDLAEIEPAFSSIPQALAVYA
jgi:hypothetical protein